ncbi:MAG TPA: hypothetical protein VF752_14580 [Thermoleophilaceae bacterium]
MAIRLHPALLTAAAVLSTLAPAAARAATPIPEGGNAATLPQFEGSPATPEPISAPLPPRHPFMAPNERSNLHVDAYQSDSNPTSGPLGNKTERASTFQGADCASVSFDQRNRIVTICVGLQGPRLVMMDPRTLDTLATFNLPPRIPTGGGIFTDFSGGGYFYLDNQDRAVLPTTTRHIYVVRETDAPGFALDKDYDVSAAVPFGDSILSAMPDWSGRIWFVSKKGVVGYVDPATGQARSLNTLEPIGNSFAVDETGGVYIVTDKAMYRFDAPAGLPPVATWREPYDNIGQMKPGQSQAGSGTTPTLIGANYVAITDNADPMKIVVYKRAATVAGSRLVCTAPVFQQGSGDTDQSLIGIGNSIVTENNYGYSSPLATENGKTTTPGLERVDIAPDGSACRTVWRSNETAPTVVPKLSLGAGLVYTYTKPPRDDGQDPWYFTALDFDTGKTVFKRLAGEGLGFNNNYAPVTIRPDSSAYVGTLGGLVRIYDTAGPAAARSAGQNAGRSSRGCLPRRGRVTGRRIGRVPLNRSYLGTIRRVGVPTHASATSLRYCVRGGGEIRAAFGNVRARLVATTAKGYRYGRVRVGSRVSRASKRILTGRHAARVSFRVRRGQVRYVVVLDRKLSKHPRQVRTYLTRAGLR